MKNVFITLIKILPLLCIHLSAFAMNDLNPIWKERAKNDPSLYNLYLYLNEVHVTTNNTSGCPSGDDYKNKDTHYSRDEINTIGAINRNNIPYDESVLRDIKNMSEKELTNKFIESWKKSGTKQPIDKYILEQHNLYACDNFLSLIKKFPSYSEHIKQTYDKYHNDDIFKQIVDDLDNIGGQKNRLFTEIPKKLAQALIPKIGFLKKFREAVADIPKKKTKAFRDFVRDEVDKINKEQVEKDKIVEDITSSTEDFTKKFGEQIDSSVNNLISNPDLEPFETKIAATQTVQENVNNNENTVSDDSKNEEDITGPRRDSNVISKVSKGISSSINTTVFSDNIIEGNGNSKTESGVVNSEETKDKDKENSADQEDNSDDNKDDQGDDDKLESDMDLDKDIDTGILDIDEQTVLKNEEKLRKPKEPSPAKQFFKKTEKVLGGTIQILDGLNKLMGSNRSAGSSYYCNPSQRHISALGMRMQTPSSISWQDLQLSPKQRAVLNYHQNNYNQKNQNLNRNSRQPNTTTTTTPTTTSSSSALDDYYSREIKRLQQEHEEIKRQYPIILDDQQSYNSDHGPRRKEKKNNRYDPYENTTTPHPDDLNAQAEQAFHENIGTEGFVATASNGQKIVIDQLQRFINKNKKINSELSASSGNNPVITNICIFTNELDDLSAGIIYFYPKIAKAISLISRNTLRAGQGFLKGAKHKALNFHPV
ncbi:hypothetical protein ACFLYH_01830, partial [Candidatus Dependentiae bacterium]